MRIYVGNLPYDVGQDELKQTFGAFGEVSEVTIPTDNSGRPKGFGFVEMPSKSQAEAAITGMNGQMLKNRKLTVSEARPRAEGGAYGRGGGGYGGQRGGRY